MSDGVTCEQMYGSEFCQNVRRYVSPNFTVDNKYQKRTDDDQKSPSLSSAKKKSNNESKTKRIPIRIRPLDPTISDLTHDQMQKAKMVKASKIAYESGFEEAQMYLDKNGIPYDIDQSLSSKESLVLLSDTDNVKIAYRGTKIQNLNDVRADVEIVAGSEANNPQFKSAEEQLKLVTEKYGAPSELIGYSLGGNKAMYLGNKSNIPTTTFNPFLGKNLVNSKTGDHTIFRTTEDFASMGIGLTGSKWKVSSILPHKDKLNPIEAHKLENFTEISSRRPGHTETMLQSVNSQGMKVGEMELIHKIKAAQENGLTFTEFVHEFNGGRGNDTTIDGSSLTGSRMHQESKFVKYWEEAKSEGSSSSPFTEKEMSHFDSIESSESTYQNALRSKQRKDFRNSSPSEQLAQIGKEHSTLKTLADAVDTHTEPYRASANVLKRSIHPSNLATGIVGGVAASTLMNTIDKDHKISEVPREGIEGSIAGITTEMGAAALAGTALSASTLGVGAVAGGVSYLTGNESAKLITHGLEAAHVDTNVSEALGSTAGGAIGGGVAAGTAIGGAALMGTEIGSMGGPLGMAVGAGIGSLFGIGGYLLGKLGG